MTDARTDILGKVTAALGGEPSGIGLGEYGAVPRAYRAASDITPGSAQAVEILVDRLVDYRAVVHAVAQESQIADAIAQILDDHPTLVRPPALPQGWLEKLPGTVTVYTDSEPTYLTPNELDQIDAVVTGCRVACADTGTIILDGQPDQGRRAITLVPDTHIVVVYTQQIVHVLPEAVAVLAEHPTRPLTWISGPSATSDIELNRVEGVHGPRNLHVIVVG